MSKVLLVYPYCIEERVHAEDASIIPIGLYYVGSVLKEHGHDVEILNWHDIKNMPEKIAEILAQKKPDVLGLSIVHANRWGGIEIARIARRAVSSTKIVFGGIGTTFLWKHLLTHCPEIDFAVLGEGEYTFLQLVERLKDADSNTFSDIKGIAYRNAGTIMKTEEAEVIKDLDRLPMPAKHFDFQHLSSSRGCPANCTFCGSPKFWGHKVRFHSARYFVDQLEILCRKGIRFFYVSDDTFTMRKDRVIEICKGIIEKGLPVTWVAISRVNYTDEEMLYWMRKAGCIQISYGVESGAEKIREKLNKKITLDDIRRAFRLTVSYGILARAYYIYGCPGEDDETIQQTIDLINETQPLSVIFYILDIFPGTALYHEYRERTGADDTVWLQRIEDIMYFETDRKLSVEKILSFGERLRSEYYRSLPRFAREVELIDRKDLNESHADFLSRLAMTFTHGEYSSNSAIPEKDETAERLYRRSLAYFQNQRAYLGLGVLLQKKKDYRSSIPILSEGFARYPSDESLGTCLGISHMNLGNHKEALSSLLKFPESPTARKFAAICYQAMGDFARARELELKATKNE